ncbi:MAG: hypothetical protein J2P32_02735 [Actinobacteria bacterium]|nr:hypothetical protein [Actinomycetota bacterium]
MVAAIFYLGPGLWAFLDPHSFAEETERAPIVHLAHDMGAFMVGLGVWAIVSIIRSDALGSAFLGLATTSAADAVVHVEDMHLGHIRPIEPWILGALTVLLIAAFIAWRSQPAPKTGQDAGWSREDQGDARRVAPGES